MSSKAPPSPKPRASKAPPPPITKPNPFWLGLLNVWVNIEANLLIAFVALVFFTCIALALFNQPRKSITLELPIAFGAPVASTVPANAVPSGPLQILGFVNGKLLISSGAAISALDLPAPIQPALASVTVSAPYSLSGPVWSPDGSSTVFLSKRDGVMRLFVGTPNGVRVLTPLQLSNGFVLNERTWIAWASDGKHVALTAQSPEALSSQVLIAATEREEVKPISDDKRSVYSPLWLDSQTLVFVSADANGNAEIILTDLNGANPQVVFKTK